MEAQTFRQTRSMLDTEDRVSASASPSAGVSRAAAPAAKLSVIYRLNPDDIFAAQWHYVQTSPSIKRNYRIIFYASLLIVFCLTALLMLKGILPIIFASVCYVVFAALMTWKWPQACRDGVRRQIDKLLREGRNAHLQGEIRMELDETSLSVRSAHGESRLTWETIERVDETDAHVFIRIGSTAQHVVPKWAFESRRGAEEFVEAARCFQRRAEFS